MDICVRNIISCYLYQGFCVLVGVAPKFVDDCQSFLSWQLEAAGSSETVIPIYEYENSGRQITEQRNLCRHGLFWEVWRGVLGESSNYQKAPICFVMTERLSVCLSKALSHFT
jgi:hypothetical protein